MNSNSNPSLLTTARKRSGDGVLRRLLQPLATTALAAFLVLSSCLPVNGLDLSEIAASEAKIKEATRAYMGNYPAGNNDPRPVRQRFLGTDQNDQPVGSLTGSPSAILGGALDEVLALRQQVVS